MFLYVTLDLQIRHDAKRLIPCELRHYSLLRSFRICIVEDFQW